MKIYIVRHGETEENATNIIQGWDPGKLTERGIEQARLLALRLKDERFDAVFSSDLQRAADTAHQIAKFHSNQIIYSSELRERGAGVFQGGPREELRRAETLDGRPNIDFRPQGGESYRDIHDRVVRFFESLKNRISHETILIVTHGGWSRIAIGKITGKTIEESLKIPQENTCANIIEIDEYSRCNILLFNCTKHLT